MGLFCPLLPLGFFCLQGLRLLGLVTCLGLAPFTLVLSGLSGVLCLLPAARVSAAADF